MSIVKIALTKAQMGGVSRVMTTRSFSDLGKVLIDPCGGWTWGSLFTPLKPASTPLPEVRDVSIAGLELSSVVAALKNMSVPAESEKVTLGRWGKTTEQHTLTKKYT
jgi:hypothetical protein